jgi:uncharacterized protein (DUF927 family)
MNSLDPQHLADLHKSGLTDATIEQAGFVSLRPCDIERETGIRTLPLLSAYRIPFDARYSRFKLFYNEDAPDGAKRPKYIQKAGQANRLYIPPMLSETDLKSPQNQELDLLGGQPTIYFTEGEKKALKATQEGLPCIGITGLWNWKRKGTDDLIPDFGKINLAGRKIGIVPDSDWLDLDKDGKQKNLKSAVYRFATALMLRGAVVKIAHLPADGTGKVGLDDYLLRHSVDDFMELKHEKVTPRPCFRNEAGSLNFYGVKDDAFVAPVKIAAAIEVMAFTRDNRNEAWGKMLHFRDKDNVDHFWPMPMELLSGDGSELRSKLYEKGLPFIAIGRNLRQLLLNYLQTAQPDKGRRARCVDRTGWHDEKLFVLPVDSIGANGDEPIVYQGKTDPVISQQGTVQNWIDNVGIYCTGNSRLLFSVSMAFVAPLLYTVSAENFGANLFGSSSTGKTTGLKVACSIWGGRDYMLRWRATGNGLEGIATAHNDLFMGLDELAQVSPHEAGEIAYMLANGAGKTRANRAGEARASKKWRICFLSTGEITLSEHVSSSGKKVKAGQEVRLADIPADTGKYGLFEELHGFDNGAKLSQHLNAAVGDYYGAVGIAYLKQVVVDAQELPDAIRKERTAFVAAVCPKGADGQVSRVAGFFGLVAAAGEYATINQLTGWKEGAARNAASTCFKAWLDNRGGAGAKEVDRILEDVRLFIENHGDSRFAYKDRNDDRTIINRAGYRDDEYYYILPETFKREILKGHNVTLAKKVLIERGILLPGNSNDRYTQKIRVDNQTMNVFVINANNLHGTTEL